MVTVAVLGASQPLATRADTTLAVVDRLARIPCGWNSQVKQRDSMTLGSVCASPASDTVLGNPLEPSEPAVSTKVTPWPLYCVLTSVPAARLSNSIVVVMSADAGATPGPTVSVSVTARATAARRRPAVRALEDVPWFAMTAPVAP